MAVIASIQTRELLRQIIDLISMKNLKKWASWEIERKVSCPFMEIQWFMYKKVIKFCVFRLSSNINILLLNKFKLYILKLKIKHWFFCYFLLGIKEVKFVREFSHEQMIMTIYIDDQICKRYFKPYNKWNKTRPVKNVKLYV